MIAVGNEQALNVLSDDVSLLRDLEAIESKLKTGIRSRLELPRSLAERLVLAGGKRVRPMLMCMTYRSLLAKGLGAVNENPSRASLDDLYTLATVAEWVHTATLFHDDVLDGAPTRRELTTAHVLHGNKVAILVGDIVYAEAFALLMDRGLLQASQSLAHTIKELVEGELLQFDVSRSRRLSMDDYRQIARSKTASLFSWCTGVGAWAAGVAHVEGAARFGHALGLAFQMADDLLDTASLDLKEWTEGAAPLPVLLAYELDTKKVKDLWEKAFEDETAALTLQKLCHSASVIENSEKLMNATLQDATSFLSDLGPDSLLSKALDIISLRVQESLDTARKFAKQI